METVAKPKLVQRAHLYPLIAGVRIDATNGTETMRSSGLFSGGIYGVDLPNGAGSRTGEVLVDINEVNRDGNFSELLGL
jgi:hypothetical protein